MSAKALARHRQPEAQLSELSIYKQFRKQMRKTHLKTVFFAIAFAVASRSGPHSCVDLHLSGLLPPHAKIEETPSCNEESPAKRKETG
jgi:hypothetical protein